VITGVLLTGAIIGVGALAVTWTGRGWREIKQFAKDNGMRYVLWEMPDRWSQKRPVEASNDLAALQKRGEALRDTHNYDETGWDGGIYDVVADRYRDSYG
jgi:hypothetical protein